jgi:Flp pilus assembly protein TadG
VKRRRRGESGQALVEFAITLPIFLLFVFTVIELSLVFIAYYSETRTARESARWLAVNSRTTDDGPGGTAPQDLADHVRTTMEPGMIGGTPTVVTTGDATHDAVWKVGSMTLTFTPCEWNGTVCGHAARTPGSTLYVTMSYDVSNLLFLPTTFKFGSLTTTLPAALPAYTVHVMVE